MRTFVTYLLTTLLITLSSFAQTLPALPSTWQDMGVPAFSAGNAKYTSMQKNSLGEYYVAYEDAGNSSKATVMHYELGINKWKPVGIPGFSAGQAVDLSLVIHQDNLYVIYADNADNDKITVKKFNGTAWISLGSTVSSSQGLYPCLAFHPTNHTPVVVYSSPANGTKGTMKYYDNSTGTWKNSNSSSPDFSTGSANWNALTFDKNNYPVVAFQDGNLANKLSVIAYDGTSWANVGNAGFSQGMADHISIKLDSYSQSTYVSFIDKDNGNKASVAKFTGSSWAIIGTAGFTSQPISILKLAIDNSGTPCVAFSDNGNAGKISVMQFYASSWSLVESSGFSTGGIGYVDILINTTENSPVVVYADNGLSSKAVVKRYTKCIANIPSIAGNTNQYCLGATPSTLVANADAGYFLKWWGKDSIGGTSISTSSAPDVSTVGKISYFVSQSNGSVCETPRAKIDIKTIGLPTATLSGTATICQGSATNLNVFFTGSAPWSFTYTDGTTPVTLTGITANPFNYSVNPSTTKTYAITAVSDLNCSGTFSGTATVTVNANPTPSVPNSLAASAVSTTSMSANWTAATNATGYYVDVNTASDFTGTPIVNNQNTGNVTTYFVTGLTANTTYYYRIRAYNACGTSASSATSTQVTTGTMAPCYTAWNSTTWYAPNNICGNPYGGSTVSYNGYNYYLTGSYCSINEIPSTSTWSFTHQGACASLSAPTITTTNAASAITCTGATSGGTTLSDGGASITAKGVCWNTTSNPTTANSKTTDGTGSSDFTSSITGLTVGTTYYLRAYATNSVGTSYGPEILLTTATGTPSAPTSSAASSVSCTSMAANWSAKANATGYYLDVNTNNTFSGTWVLNNVNVGNVTTYSITGLTANTTYYYRVSAYNACGTSASSPTISQLTSPAIPAQPGVITGIVAQCPSLTSQTYSISAITNATSYTWTVPTGWTITAGGTTNSITVTTGTAAQNGNITVTASNACGTSTANTFAVTVAANGSLVAGTIGTAQTICSNTTPSTLTSVSFPTGGTGTYTYQWQSSLDNNTWSTIPGANSTTYSPSALQSSTYYRREETSGGCGMVKTNSILITVNANPTATLIGNNTICSGETTHLNISFTGTPPWNLVYADSASGIETLFTNISTTPDRIPVTPLTSKTYLLNAVQSASCTGTVDGKAQIRVNLPPSAKFSYAKTSYCKTETNPSPMIPMGAAAGYFTANGLDINAATGVINLSNSPIGKYKIINTVSYSACNQIKRLNYIAENTDTFEIEITNTCNKYTLVEIKVSKDVSINNSTENTNLDQQNELTIGYNGSSIARALLKFDLTSIPANAEITSANISFTTLNNSKNSVQLALHQVTNDWNSPTATWNSTGFGNWAVLGSDFNTSMSDFSILSNQVETGQVQKFNVTNDVINYLNGTNTNYGWLLKLANETINNPVILGSGDSYSEAYQPTLSIAYRLKNVPIQINSTSVTSVLCPGEATGKITITSNYTTEGDAITYTLIGKNTYTFSTTAVNYTFDKVLAGTYTAMVQNLTNSTSNSVNNIIVTETKGVKFSYGASNYCLNAANPLPIIPTGNDPVYFSAASGLIFVDHTTGKIDLQNSTAGTYKIFNTKTIAGCPTLIDSFTVNLQALPKAGFQYASVNYCKNAANPIPTLKTGAGAGIFSAPAGLSLLGAFGEINLSGSSAGSYFIKNTIAAGNGCAMVVDSFKVTIKDIPTANITGGGSICKGDSIRVKLNFSGSSPWYLTLTDGVKDSVINNIPDSIFNLDISPNSSKTVTIKNIEDATGCNNVGTGSAAVTVKPTPTANISGDTTICEGSSVPLTFNFTETAPWDFTYTNGTSPITITGISTSPYVLYVSPSSTKTYTITAINNGTCSGAGSGVAVVMVNPKPTATISGSTSICESASANLNVVFTGSSPWDFSYVEGSNATAITGISVSPYNFTVSPTSNSNYTISAVTSASCNNSGTGNANITIKPKPTATISGSTSICESASANLNVVFTGSSPWDFNYVEGSNATAITGISTSPYVFTVSPTSNSSYTISSVTSASCNNSGTGNANITVNPKPTATISGSTSICESASANLNVVFSGSSPWDFSYVEGSNAISITGISVSPYVFTVSPTSNSSYTISSVTSASCSNSGTGTAVVTVTPKPNPKFTYTDTAYCKSGNNPLTNLTNGTFTAVPALSFANAATGEIDIATIPIGDYTITNTIAASGGCAAASATDKISIANQPNASLSIFGTTEKSINVCDTDHKSIWLHIEGVRPITIRMGVNNFEKDTTINNSLNNFLFKVSPNVTSQYKLLSIYDQACKTPVAISETINISVKPSNGTTVIPEIISAGAYSFCTPNSLQLSIKTPEPGATYQWYRNGRMVVNETGNTFSVNTYGNYNVNIETCKPSGDMAIAVSQVEKIPIIMATDLGANEGTLQTDVVSSATYQWYLNDYKLLGTTENKLAVQYNGDYKVAVKTNNCTAFSHPFKVSETAYMDARIVANFQADSSVSLNSHPASEYAVVPNPTKEVIHILGPDMNLNYIIIVRDLTGTIVYKASNTLNINAEHNLSELITGLYIVELQVNNQTYFTKLVKN